MLLNLEDPLLEQPLAEAGSDKGLPVRIGDGGVRNGLLFQVVLPIIQVVTD